MKSKSKMVDRIMIFGSAEVFEMVLLMDSMSKSAASMSGVYLLIVL